jgi:hypothetical protein
LPYSDSRRIGIVETEPNMRYRALASDYDGTLASQGLVDMPTLAALERVRASGRRLILVTGRVLDELRTVFPQLAAFDRIVAENGAVLYRPVSGDQELLGEPPPADFVGELRRRGVAPLGLGRVVVATVTPHDRTVQAVLRELRLERQVIFNKGAVMVLPAGVDKATGLRAALTELEVAPRETVGVGDAENDHAFLRACGCGVAVANALPALKAAADFVTRAGHGAGVTELIDELLADDLAGRPRRSACDPQVGELRR